MRNLASDLEQEDDTVQAEKRAAENREILSQMPEGEGKRLLQSRCMDCHSLARVSAGQKTLQSWSNTLQVMIANGAVLKPEETVPLAEYLARNFGLAVNINKASVTELAKIPLLNEKLAIALVDYREKKGAFAKIEDVRNVDGWSENILQKVRARLTVGIAPRKPQ